MKHNKTMSWSDISLRQFNEIRSLVDIEDSEEKGYEIAKIVFGNDVENLPIREFSLKLRQLSFMSEEIPSNRTVKKYSINGHRYEISLKLDKFTTAQYIDYTNLLKTDEMNKYLAVFFIPEGHSYNDGYDLELVMNDILDVDIVTINSLAFFFKKMYLIFIKCIQHYSIKLMKKLKISKEMKKNLIQLLETLTNLASSHLF